MKIRRMRWAGHVACMWEKRDYTGFWWRNLREKDHLKDPGVDGRTMVKWIFRKWDVRVWTRLIWLGMGTGDGHL